MACSVRNCHPESTLKQLEFTDCKHCGKRVAKTARRCGHCGFRPSQTAKPLDYDESSEQPDEDSSEAHHATGGYDESQDDFDYDEYVKDEYVKDELESHPYGSTKRNLWWYVALFMLILFAVTAVLPIF